MRTDALPRRRMLCLVLAGVSLRCLAQPSALDWIAGRIVRINPEAGKISIEHGGIPHLHLAAGTSTFRYLETRLVIGRQPGDNVRFRADRVDLELRLTGLVFIPR